MSLIAGVLTFSGGAVVVSTTDDPRAFNGGTPTLDSGSLCTIEGSTAQPFALGGQHYNGAGRLGADLSGAIVTYAGGIPLTAEGNVAIEYNDPYSWVAGIPLTATGRVAVSTGGLLTGCLLQEDGFRILQEDDFCILIEPTYFYLAQEDGSFLLQENDFKISA
jgi:hypothetical protein